MFKSCAEISERAAIHCSNGALSSDRDNDEDVDDDEEEEEKHRHGLFSSTPVETADGAGCSADDWNRLVVFRSAVVQQKLPRLLVVRRGKAFRCHHGQDSTSEDDDDGGKPNFIVLRVKVGTVFFLIFSTGCAGVDL